MPFSLPRLTVIVAVWNGAATLERCLASIVGQTYPNTELIIMDGGSTDGTVALLRRFSGQIAYWESEADRGIYHAWNKALTHATGDWVCFLGADDYFWSDTVLAQMASHLTDAVPEARLVYGTAAIVGTGGDVLRFEGRPWPEAAPEFRRTMSIPHPGLLHHHSLFAEHGGFDESFRIAADYDLLLRELPARPARFIPNMTTVGVQRGGVSYSPTALPQMLAELAQVRRKHGLPSPGLLQMTSVERKMRTAALLGRVLGDGGSRRVLDSVRRIGQYKVAGKR